MIRKYHNHKPKTNPWHNEEEPHNHHVTPGRQTKQSNQLYLPHQDDCKTRMNIKQVSKPPEQSDTKVSNSLIQIGLTFKAFVRPSVYSQIGQPNLRGKHMAKYDIHIMGSLPGVLGNRANDIHSREQGTKVKF